MNGTVSLIIALVSYGNTYLSGNHQYLLDFNNSTLVYNNSLIFNNYKNTLETHVIANSPQQWFEFLKKDDCKKLRIFYRHSENQLQLKDFESAAFVGGGGNWMIEAVYNNHSNYWGFNEESNKSKTDNRIWKTEFFVVKNKVSSQKSESIDKAKHNLFVALTNITMFAVKENQKHWVGEFERAKKVLTDPNPTVEYYTDFIVPASLSLQAKQLLFSANIADVFGGMGSWNDILYDTKEADNLNKKLSADLFDKINDAILTALNN